MVLSSLMISGAMHLFPFFPKWIVCNMQLWQSTASECMSYVNKTCSFAFLIFVASVPMSIPESLENICVLKLNCNKLSVTLSLMWTRHCLWAFVIFKFTFFHAYSSYIVYSCWIYSPGVLHCNATGLSTRCFQVHPVKQKTIAETIAIQSRYEVDSRSTVLSSLVISGEHASFPILFHEVKNCAICSYGNQMPLSACLT